MTVQVGVHAGLLHADRELAAVARVERAREEPTDVESDASGPGRDDD